MRCVPLSNLILTVPLRFGLHLVLRSATSTGPASMWVPRLPHGQWLPVATCRRSSNGNRSSPVPEYKPREGRGAGEASG